LSIKQGVLSAIGATSSTQLKNRLISLGPLFAGVHSVNIDQLNLLSPGKQQVKQ